ncbi:MAG: DNA polymerase/3'-5' exonuclease PolX [Candidatus Rokubacteria bacterium]|nr:DNA polymerase/3'-5' exonuclease PolX [Candidatus Rokubacteria bacterium]
MKNFEIARLFHEIAALLDARQESRFRIRAYQRAAQTLETLGEDVGAVAARGGLQGLPGIGKELAARIEEYLATGAMRHVEQLRGDLPAAFPMLLEVRGLGPKTARALHEKLGIGTIEQLEEACRTGRIIGVAGVREKTRDKILKGISAWRAGRTRTPLHVARAIAGQVVDVLRAHGGIDDIQIAGSLRRGRETVKDIDILVTSREPMRVMHTFTHLPSTAEVLGHGPTRATILHQEGLHVDLRVVEPEAFGAALQYFTGSKDHNVRVREIAVRKGLRLSEYGVFDEATGARIAGATEDDVYAAVGLPWIPPELRENGGEIEAARAGALPALVTTADMRGDLHAHTDWSDGRHPLDTLIAAAEARGYEYIIVSDHSQSTAIANGLTVERLRAQRTLIRQIQPRFKIRILAGSECDILADGRMDFPDEELAGLDVVLAAVHSRFKQERAAMTSRIVRALEHPHVDILVHPTGRRIGTREPYDVDLDAVFAAAKRHGKAVEINSSPERLDLPDAHARRAAEHGIPIAITTDTHGLPELDHIELGVTVARRAWIGPAQVLNTRGLEDLLTWTRR